MECKYVEEICAAVDGCLPAEEMSTFLKHTTECPQCRWEFEMQGAVKKFVAQGIHRQVTPQVLRARIARQSSAHRDTPASGLFANVFQNPVARAAFALGLLAIVIIGYFLSPGVKESEPTHAGIISIVQQSLENYLAVMNGEITPQVSATDHQVLKNFFEGKTGFEVLVPRMKECNLVGGVVNQSKDGVPLAHVVYTDEQDRLLYMYQACWDQVEAKKLYLPDSIQSTLMKTRWFAETRADGHSIVLWLRERTLCAAVAHMPKDELIACLQSDESMQ